MVDVTHDGNDRSTRLKVFGCILLFDDGVAYLLTHVTCGETEFFGNDIDCLGIEALVDTYHHTD